MQKAQPNLRSYLNGWLFGIDISRIKEELKPRLMEYQRECFRVLADHFLPQSAAGKRLPKQPELRLSALALAAAALPRLHGGTDLTGFLPLLTLRPPRGPAVLPTQTLRPRHLRRGHQYNLLLSVTETMYWQLDALHTLFEKLESMAINVRLA